MIVFVCLLVISRLSHDGDQNKTKEKWDCLRIALSNRSMSANEDLLDHRSYTHNLSSCEIKD